MLVMLAWESMELSVSSRFSSNQAVSREYLRAHRASHAIKSLRASAKSRRA
jgi:hypothetical protein